MENNFDLRILVFTCTWNLSIKNKKVTFLLLYILFYLNLLRYLICLLLNNRSNEERGKIGRKSTKMGSFWGAVFYENTSGKSKFSSNGAEFFWAPPILKLNFAYVATELQRFLSEDPSSSSSLVHFQMPKNFQSFEDFWLKIQRFYGKI